jgi:ParB family chromosome partitioning protein
VPRAAPPRSDGDRARRCRRGHPPPGVRRGIRAENDALAPEFVRPKRLGLAVAEIPRDAVPTTRLVRDRAAAGELVLGARVASIRGLGLLSNPIRVEARPDSRFELVQGLRRLAACRALRAQTGDDRWARIPAVVMAAGEDLPALDRRMAEENLIGKGVSGTEMASLDLGYAAEAGVELDAAVNTPFASRAVQKRS